MKNCEKCDKKIKNGFKFCYSCNDSKSETSEPETPKLPYVKDIIPRAVKNCLWINYFGDKRVGVCACCQREPITINNFHAGHIKSEREGGSTTLDNLACICPLCNLSMSTMNMMDFITKYNLHYGLGQIPK
jgi:HNH endonuclease